jgi:aminoglycoside 2'-N-acetyltransferase I
VLAVRVERTADLSREELDAIRAMLSAAFEGDFAEEDWHHALGGWHVIALDGVPVGHAAVVERAIEVDGRPVRAGYVEGVATAPVRRGEGVGSTVMQRVADELRAHFDIGILSTSVDAFYEPLGWEHWRGPTFVRHGPEAVRTADDDDGIMVLRFGPTADLDLGLPISCEARSGDDW